MTDRTSSLHQFDQVRAVMARAMERSREVARVTIFDDADISLWHEPKMITVRGVRAIIAACKVVPMMNVHYYPGLPPEYESFDGVHLGLAVDTPHGLYVPVIKDAQQYLDNELLERIRSLNTSAHERSLKLEDIQGATISLTNFGTLAGRYSTPIIVPPQVAIVGLGRSYSVPYSFLSRYLPISLSFDHRVVTGGEAARFLKALKDHFALKTA